jgi:hypothetical protein
MPLSVLLAPQEDTTYSLTSTDSLSKASTAEAIARFNSFSFLYVTPDGWLYMWFQRDRTRHNKTGQDKTGQDRTGQDRTGQDKTEQNVREQIPIITEMTDS